MAKEQTAVFGGGCFWCIEAVFQRLTGVTHVESGYMGGRADQATYRQVCNGDTGHVEVVRSEEHTSELQSQSNLVCRLLLEKKKKPTACTSSSRTAVCFMRLYVI